MDTEVQSPFTFDFESSFKVNSISTSNFKSKKSQTSQVRVNAAVAASASKVKLSEILELPIGCVMLRRFAQDECMLQPLLFWYVGLKSEKLKKRGSIG